MKKIYLYAISFLAVANVCFGANRYVDGSAGNDNNNGSSTGSAWLTIGHAMATASPGDTVLCKGGIYREHIKLYSGGGTSGNQITIKNYDSNEVILDGSVPVSGWSVDTGQIYKVTPGATVDAVVVDYVALKPAVSQSNSNAGYTDTTTRAGVTISEGQFYQDNSTGILYVWFPGGGAPSSHNIGIIRTTPDTSSQYDGVYLWDAGYFTFQNITIRYYGARGFEASGASSHNIFDNVKILFNRHTGVVSGPYSQLTNCEIAWNFLWNWPRGKFNGGTQGGGWGAGTSIGANSLVTGCKIYKNGGEGLLTYMNPGGTTFTGNTIYDNWSMNLYIDTAPNVIAEKNFIYCSNPNTNDALPSAFSSDGTIYKGLLPIGISTADEYYGGEHTNYAHDITIRNNIVANCRRGYNHYAQYSGSGMINIHILNNTIITPDFSVPGTVTIGDGDNFLGINLANYWMVGTGNIIKNNIVVARNARNYALYTQTANTYTGESPSDTFAPYDMSNNLWYNSASSTPIHWGANYDTKHDKTLAQWQALPGASHGIGDLSADPLFVSGVSIFKPSYYYPMLASPTIKAGITLQGFLSDFENKARPVAWTLGALEPGTPVPIINSMRMN